MKIIVVGPAEGNETNRHIFFICDSSMATSLSSMGGMGGSCGLQQRDPATAAAYPSYMFAHHGADPLSSLQSSYNQHQRAAAAAAACSAAQASSVAASAHSYAAATSAHAQTG